MDVPPIQPPRVGALVLPALIILGALVFIVVPAWELIVPGPFHWHLHQKRTVQGGLEAIALIGCLAYAFGRGSRGALLAFAAAPALFYLRRHAVDVPLLVDTLYVEIVFALGALIRRACRAAPASGTQGHLHNFVTGFCVWSVAAWSQSAFGLGSVIDLRWLTLALGAVAFAARPQPFVAHLWQAARAADAKTRAICGALAGAWLVLFARSARVLGYDSLWYGLRPEHVLVADGSAFRGLGLVSPVHYFPKLYELFLTPLAALGSASVMFGIGAWLLLLIALACRLLLAESGIPRAWSWLGVALVVTLPAIANSALSAKADSLALLLVLLALLDATQYLDRRGTAHLVWFATLALLATQAKLTAIPYVGALGIALLLLARRRSEPATIVRAPPDPAEWRLGVAAFALALATAAFVTARTWLLVGMPTVGPDPLVTIWRAFGMTFTPPVGTLNWTRPQDWSDVPQLLVDELLRPQVLAHIVITWLGNVWLYLGLIVAAAALGLRRPRGSLANIARLAIAPMLTGLALLVGWRYMERGSDGNYFAIAAAAAILVGFAAAQRRLADHRLASRALAFSLGAFACFHAAYSFTSGHWADGTRKFDLDLARSVRPRHGERWRVLRDHGLAKIADALQRGDGVRRAVGVIDGDAIGFQLPCRYEDLVMVSFSRPEYVRNADALLAFMRANRIDALILPRGEWPPDVAAALRGLAGALPALAAMPGVRRIDDEKYVLLDFAASPTIGTGGPIGPPPPAERRAR